MYNVIPMLYFLFVKKVCVAHKCHEGNVLDYMTH